MNFIIRELEEADFIDSFGFIDTMANMSDISDLDLDGLKIIWQKAKQQDAHFFIAVSQEQDSKDQIVATVKLLVEPKFFHGGKAAGHIEDVVTGQGFEGQGFAKALLVEVLKKAKERGCYKVILDCKQELVGFYSKVGFEEHDICMRIDIKK
ncbi:GNAT family N-acetyltransferase [bacterium]|nr:GNAT family N-acetyltransferase [bacterium]